jgi:hypothetical protein
MSQITELARGAITAADTIALKLIEADETPAVGHRPVARKTHRATSTAVPRHGNDRRAAVCRGCLECERNDRPERGVFSSPTQG